MVDFFAKLEPTKIGIEACGGAHHWARELTALDHEVLLLPAQYVKPYVKRNKNDAADAEAICEAISRPTMRFVAVKSPQPQAAVMLAGPRGGGGGPPPPFCHTIPRAPGGGALVP